MEGTTVFITTENRGGTVGLEYKDSGSLMRYLKEKAKRGFVLTQARYVMTSLGKLCYLTLSPNDVVNTPGYKGIEYIERVGRNALVRHAQDNIEMNFIWE